MTVAELEQAMDAREWSDWVAFHAQYDLPDGYFVAAQLGVLINRALGGKASPADIVPFFKAERRGVPSGLSHAYEMLRQHARRPDGKPPQ